MAGTSTKSTPSVEELPPPPAEEKSGTDAIVDDNTWDWGTRYRPARDVPPTLHLGAMPTVPESVPTTLDSPLPPLDPDNVVVPPSNVPLEVRVQELVDKALAEKSI